MTDATPGTASGRTSFNIPKIKKNYKGAIQNVSINNRDVQNLLRDINKNCLDTNFHKEIDVLEVYMVHSDDLLSRYIKKRAEMRDEGRNVQTLNDQLGFSFVHYSNMFKVASEGLNAKPCNYGRLGKGECGVYLTRFFDVEVKNACKGRDAAIEIFVFKYISGKCKQLNLGNIYGKMTDIEPTPNYDSHVGNIAPKITDSMFVQIVKSSVYLYEYTEDCVPSKSPRHCLPFAIIRLKRRQQLAESVFRVTAPREALATLANGDSVVSPVTSDRYVSLKSKVSASVTTTAVSNTMNATNPLPAESNGNDSASPQNNQQQTVSNHSEMKRTEDACVSRNKANSNGINYKPGQKTHEKDEMSNGSTADDNTKLPAVGTKATKNEKHSTSIYLKTLPPALSQHASTFKHKTLLEDKEIHSGSLEDSDFRTHHLISARNAPNVHDQQFAKSVEACLKHNQRLDPNMYSLPSSKVDPRLQRMLPVANSSTTETTFSHHSLSDPKTTGAGKAGAVGRRLTSTKIECHKTVKRKISYSEYKRSRTGDQSTISVSTTKAVSYEKLNPKSSDFTPKTVDASEAVRHEKLTPGYSNSIPKTVQTSKTEHLKGDKIPFNTISKVQHEIQNTKCSDSISKAVDTSGTVQHKQGKLDKSSSHSISKAPGASEAVQHGKSDKRSSNSLSKDLDTSKAVQHEKSDKGTSNSLSKALDTSEAVQHRKSDKRSSNSISQPVAASEAVQHGKSDKRSSNSLSKVLDTSEAVQHRKSDKRSSNSTYKPVATSEAVQHGKSDKRSSNSISQPGDTSEAVQHGKSDKRSSNSMSKPGDASEAVQHGQFYNKSTHNPELTISGVHHSETAHFVCTQSLENVQRVVEKVLKYKKIDTAKISNCSASADLSEMAKVIQKPVHNKLYDVPTSSCEKAENQSNLYVADTYNAHRKARDLENLCSEIQLEDNDNYRLHGTSSCEIKNVSERTKQDDSKGIPNRGHHVEEQPNSRQRLHCNQADENSLIDVGTDTDINTENHCPNHTSSSGSIPQPHSTAKSKYLKSSHFHRPHKSKSGKRGISNCKSQTLPSATSSNSHCTSSLLKKDSTRFTLEEENISHCVNNSFVEDACCEQIQQCTNLEQTCRAAFTTKANPSGEKPLPQSVSMRDVGIECYLLALGDMNYQPLTVLVDFLQVKYKKECKVCNHSQHAELLIEDIDELRSFDWTENQHTRSVTPHSNVMTEASSPASDASGNISIAPTLNEVTGASLSNWSLPFVEINNCDYGYSPVVDANHIITNNVHSTVIEDSPISASSATADTEKAQEMSVPPLSKFSFANSPNVESEFHSAASSCSSEFMLESCNTVGPDDNDTPLTHRSLLNLTSSVKEEKTHRNKTNDIVQGSVLTSSKNYYSEEEVNYHSAAEDNLRDPALSPRECDLGANCDLNTPKYVTVYAQKPSIETNNVQAHLSENESDEELFREHLLEKTYKLSQNGKVKSLNKLDVKIASRWERLRETFTSKKCLLQTKLTIKECARETSPSSSILKKETHSKTDGTGQIYNEIRGKAKRKSACELNPEVTKPNCKIPRDTSFKPDLMACIPQASSLVMLSSSNREQSEQIAAAPVKTTRLDNKWENEKSLYFEKNSKATLFQHKTNGLEQNSFVENKKKHSKFVNEVLPVALVGGGHQLVKEVLSDALVGAELVKEVLPDALDGAELVKEVLPDALVGAELVKEVLSDALVGSELVKEVLPSALDGTELVKEVLPSAMVGSELVKEVLPNALDRAELVKEVLPDAMVGAELVKEVLPNALDGAELVKEVLPNALDGAELVKEVLPNALVRGKIATEKEDILSSALVGSGDEFEKMLPSSLVGDKLKELQPDAFFGAQSQLKKKVLSGALGEVQHELGKEILPVRFVGDEKKPLACVVVERKKAEFSEALSKFPQKQASLLESDVEKIPKVDIHLKYSSQHRSIDNEAALISPTSENSSASYKLLSQPAAQLMEENLHSGHHLSTQGEESSQASSKKQDNKFDVKMKPCNSSFLVKLFLDKVKEGSEKKKHLDEEFEVFQNEVVGLDTKTTEDTQLESLMEKRAVTPDTSVQLANNISGEMTCKETVDVYRGCFSSSSHNSKHASIQNELKDCNVENKQVSIGTTSSRKSTNIDNCCVKPSQAQDDIEQYFTLTGEAVDKTNQLTSAEAIDLNTPSVSAHTESIHHFENGIKSVQSMQDTFSCDSLSDNAAQSDFKVARPFVDWPSVHKNSNLWSSHAFVDLNTKTLATERHPDLNNYWDYSGHRASTHLQNFPQQSWTAASICSTPASISNYVQPQTNSMVGLGYERFPQSSSHLFSDRAHCQNKKPETCISSRNEHTTSIQSPATADKLKWQCHDSSTLNIDAANTLKLSDSTNTSSHASFWLSPKGCGTNSISGLEFVTSDTQSSGIPGLDTMSRQKCSEKCSEKSNHLQSVSTTVGDERIQEAATFDPKLIWPEMYEKSPVDPMTPNKEKCKSIVRLLKNISPKQTTPDSMTFQITDDDYSDDQENESDDQEDVLFQVSSAEPNSVETAKNITVLVSTERAGHLPEGSEDEESPSTKCQDKLQEDLSEEIADLLVAHLTNTHEECNTKNPLQVLQQLKEAFADKRAETSHTAGPERQIKSIDLLIDKSFRAPEDSHNDESSSFCGTHKDTKDKADSQVAMPEMDLQNKPFSGFCYQGNMSLAPECRIEEEGNRDYIEVPKSQASEPRNNTITFRPRCLNRNVIRKSQSASVLYSYPRTVPSKQDSWSNEEHSQESYGAVQSRLESSVSETPIVRYTVKHTTSSESNQSSPNLAGTNSRQRKICSKQRKICSKQRKVCRKKQRASCSINQESRTLDTKAPSRQKDGKRRQPDSLLEPDEAPDLEINKEADLNCPSLNTLDPVCSDTFSDRKFYLADVPLSVLSYARNKIMSEINQLEDSSQDSIAETITSSHEESCTRAESSGETNENLLSSSHQKYSHLSGDDYEEVSSSEEGTRVGSYRDTVSNSCSSENNRTPKSSGEDDDSKYSKRIIYFGGIKQKRKHKTTESFAQEELKSGKTENHKETCSVKSDYLNKDVQLKRHEDAVYESIGMKLNAPQKCSTPEKEAALNSSESVNKNNKITPEAVSKKCLSEKERNFALKESATSCTFSKNNLSENDCSRAAKTFSHAGNNDQRKLVVANSSNVLKTLSQQGVEKQGQVKHTVTKFPPLSKANTTNETMLAKKERESENQDTPGKLTVMQSDTGKLLGNRLSELDVCDINHKKNNIFLSTHQRNLSPAFSTETKENHNINKNTTELDRDTFSSLASVTVCSSTDIHSAKTKVEQKHEKPKRNILKQDTRMNNKIKQKIVPEVSTTVNIVKNSVQQDSTLVPQCSEASTTPDSQKIVQTVTLEQNLDQQISDSEGESVQELACTQTRVNRCNEVKNHQPNPATRVNKWKRTFITTAAETNALNNSTTNGKRAKSPSPPAGDTTNVSLCSVEAKRRRVNSSDSSISSSSSYRHVRSSSVSSPQRVGHKSSHRPSSRLRDRSLSGSKTSRSSSSFSRDSRSQHRRRSYGQFKRSNSSSSYSPSYRRHNSRSISPSPNCRGGHRSPANQHSTQFSQRQKRRYSPRQQQRHKSSKRSRRSISSSRSHYGSSISEGRRRSWSKSPNKLICFSVRRDNLSKSSTCNELDYYSSRTKNGRIWSQQHHKSGSNKSRTQHPYDMLYSAANMSVPTSSGCFVSDKQHVADTHNEQLKDGANINKTNITRRSKAEMMPFSETSISYTDMPSRDCSTQWEHEQYLIKHITVKDFIISQLGILFRDHIEHILPYPLTTVLSSPYYTHTERIRIAREIILCCFKHVGIPEHLILQNNIEPVINTFGKPPIGHWWLEHFPDDQILLEANVIRQCVKTLADQQIQFSKSGYCKKLNKRKIALLGKINSAKWMETTHPNSVSAETLSNLLSELNAVTQKQNSTENYETCDDTSPFYVQDIPEKFKVPVNDFTFCSPKKALSKNRAMDIKEALETTEMRMLALLNCFNFGREHFRIPELLLLEEEKFQLYSKGNCFLILKQSLSKKVFVHLLTLKNSIEMLQRDTEKSPEEKFACSQDLIRERATVLLQFTVGKITKKNVAKVQNLSETLLDCQSYIRSVIGPDGLRRLPVFNAFFKAVRFHSRLLTDELKNSSASEYND